MKVTANRLSKLIAIVLASTILITLLVGCTKVDKVKINDRKIELAVGETYKIDYDVEPSSAESSATWESSDEDVATVNSKGKVTAVEAGECEIILKVGNKSDSVTVIVTDGPDFRELYDDYCDSSWASVASDNSYLSLSIGEFDYYNHPERLSSLQSINSELGLPQSVIEGMGNVRAIDGRITETYGDIDVAYQYNGSVLSVTYTYNR